jgi:hypothetical protein
MSKISRHQLDDEDDVKIIQHNIDNILDWGVLNRVKEIKSVLQKIHAQELKSPNLPHLAERGEKSKRRLTGPCSRIKKIITY